MDGYGSIYARVRNANTVKKISTGYTIMNEEWDLFRSKKYNADDIIRSLNIRYGDFGNILEQIKGYIEEETDFSAASETIAEIKKAVASSMEKRRKKKNIIRNNETMLVGFLEQLTEEYKTGERVRKQTSEKVSKSRIKHFSHLVKTLKKFEEDIDHHYTLDEVTMEFQQEFIKWGTEVPFQPNTIHSLMYLLRTSMRIANESKLTKNEAYLNKSFVPKLEEVDNIYLNIQQINEMYELDLSTPEAIRALVGRSGINKKKREEVERQLNSRNPRIIEMCRDIFMVGCFTGQRLSDYSRINSSMIKTIKGGKFIKVVQKKTGKEVYIPLDVRVKSILDKYNGQLPYYADNVVNANLKLIAELLKWTWKVSLEGKRADGKKSMRFCDMISSHTARRSFATNAYAANVPLASIMAITGHSREEKLRVYLRLQTEEKAIIAANDMMGFIK